MSTVDAALIAGFVIAFGEAVVTSESIPERIAWLGRTGRGGSWPLVVEPTGRLDGGIDGGESTGDPHPTPRTEEP